MKLIELSKGEFDAVCYARNARIMPILSEVAYYKAEDSELYGVIARDITDGDFGAVVLGRDADKRFRAIEVPGRFYEKPEGALTELVQTFAKLMAEGLPVYEQGDEKGKPNELYKVVAKPDNIHKLFSELVNNPTYSPAKVFLGEAVYAYVDVDGNYIKDFQSTGFKSRLWELYLYIFLKHQGFEFDTSFNAPDYLIDKKGFTIALEATTVNADLRFDEPFPNLQSEVFRLAEDYMPIKFGSSLYSKLQKEYWKLPHVKNKPLILAIHDFHMAELLDWSQRSLRNYLYGCRYKTALNNSHIELVLDDHQLPIPQIVKRHTYKHKDIPSNFFNQPGAENVSAVLFCNNATLDTFNRFGKLAGMGDYKRPITKISEVNDPQTSSYTPRNLTTDINEKGYQEAWEDTMCLFHNANAKHRIPEEVFPGLTHCYFDSNANRWSGPKRTPEILRSFNRYT